MTIKSMKECYPGVKIGQTICIAPRYNLLYIVNPKAACSSIKVLLSRLESGDFEFDAPNIHQSGASLFPMPSQIGWEKIEKNLKNPSEYFRFSFVRNPVSRIVSCYNDKIVKQSAHFVTDLKKEAGYEDTASTEMGFPEFLKIIRKQNSDDMNQHWRPQSYNLMLDSIDYDFIGKIENFDQDFNYVLASADCPPMEIVKKNKYRTKDKKLSIYDLHSDEMNIISEIYSEDFQIFDYSPDVACASGGGQSVVESVR